MVTLDPTQCSHWFLQESVIINLELIHWWIYFGRRHKKYRLINKKLKAGKWQCASQFKFYLRCKRIELEIYWNIFIWFLIYQKSRISGEMSWKKVWSCSQRQQIIVLLVTMLEITDWAGLLLLGCLQTPLFTVIYIKSSQANISLFITFQHFIPMRMGFLFLFKLAETTKWGYKLGANKLGH